ncbi:hypothetical protein K5X82_11400 [Halosquirtibacter xylanolyticus]|uniref:hypothetical protein n=1 Tax=Halosquirtibacter xylanolyticus TaxID=3374599 RepID=UPI00374A1AAB|nr:hypothetical protein K5X82_11400 [Prolixibacteraceae bacterium]
MKTTTFHIKDYIDLLDQLSEGKEVVISQPYGLLRTSEYLYTNLFPQNIRDIPACRSLMKEIRNMRYMAPHLILPQRVVSIHHSSFKSKLSSSGFQMFMSETDDEEAYPLRSDKLKDFDAFDFSIFPHATLSTEYRMDWSRLIILLLRQLNELGAKIEVADDNTVELQGAYRGMLGDPIIISQSSIPSPLYIRFRSCVVMVIPKSDDTLYIGISGEWEASYGESLSKLNPTLFTNQLLNEMNGGKGAIRVWEPALMGQSFHIDKVKEGIKGLSTTSLKVHKSVPSLRELIAQCDRKYDMYKEVNSSRSLMKEYFYRYGEDTDEIAEILYEHLHTLDRSDPKSAWAASERIFQEEHEFLK